MRQGSGNINELEEFVVNSYQPEMINSEPKTEKELLFIYQKYTVPLYDYMRHIFQFVYPISNEIRAMLGHLSVRVGERVFAPYHGTQVDSLL